MDTRQTVMLEDIEVSYMMQGRQDAPVVLLTHGILSSLSMWDAVADALLPRWCVLRYDLRGHGRTSATRPPYSMAQLAHDAFNLVEKLGIHRVHFVGSSLGGMIGQRLAADFGERLHSATLANTISEQGDVAAWQERIDTARSSGVGPLIDGTLKRWFTPGFFASRASTVERLRKIGTETSPDGFIGCAAAVRDLAHANLVKNIQVPTLVLAGAHDTATPRDQTEKLAHAIPGAQFVVLPAAHQAAVECPREFADAWETFVGGTRSTTS
jgi:3-oxoadipate enol-lactonase